jgi:hypothetical protein
MGFARDQGGLGTVGRADLAIESFHMQLDRGFGDVEVAGDLLV